MFLHVFLCVCVHVCFSRYNLLVTEEISQVIFRNKWDQIFAGDDVYLFAQTEDVTRTLEIFGKTQRKQERVVIVGGGNVGLAVAEALEARTERVRAKVIERDRPIAERAADALERTIVLNGDGLDAMILEEANISKADAILAVTDDDKTNILASAEDL